MKEGKEMIEFFKSMFNGKRSPMRLPHAPKFIPPQGVSGTAPQTNTTAKKDEILGLLKHIEALERRVSELIADRADVDKECCRLRFESTVFERQVRGLLDQVRRLKEEKIQALKPNNQLHYPSKPGGETKYGFPYVPLNVSLMTGKCEYADRYVDHPPHTLIVTCSGLCLYCHNERERQEKEVNQPLDFQVVS